MNKNPVVPILPHIHRSHRYYHTSLTAIGSSCPCISEARCNCNCQAILCELMCQCLAWISWKWSFRNCDAESDHYPNFCSRMCFKGNFDCWDLSWSNYFSYNCSRRLLADFLPYPLRKGYSKDGHFSRISHSVLSAGPYYLRKCYYYYFFDNW